MIGQFQIDLFHFSHHNTLDPESQKEKLEKCRKDLGTADKQNRDMEMQWAMLKPNEKGYYKNKLAEKRKKYDQIRHKFFRIEEAVDKVYKEYETERKARYRLTDGIAELHRQGD